ncbi:type III secretion system export apparatus subunit SctT [Burkholderia sp. TSV86]|uniref:type III secretion system export apparatus subunit SctT n=1 Tax=Burkholderia sp. TSV86 TaxID=1385594 RepID=UPI000753F257|nr:type III secretion system export apparatus subunit SctT [Burkholderia sp. TSV86]KVE37985.1 type III secretion system protein [Burkholderia sp. TSV86]
MNDTLTIFPYGPLLVQYATVIGLCSLRFAVPALMFPPIANGLSGSVRTGVVLLFGSFVAYGQPLSLGQKIQGMAALLMTGREILIGLLIGFAASSVFWAVENAGIYIDNLTGYNNAQVSNPLRQEQSTPTSTLLSQIATVAFWSLGGMTFLLGAIYESYRWWPIAAIKPIPLNILESFVLTQSDSLMQLTTKLALPIVFILLLVDFAFGFIAKSAEKLDLGTFSQPIKGALTVLILALFAGLVIDQTRSQLTLHALGTQLKYWIGH